MILPSLWLLWFVIKHLIRLYFNEGLYSFGVHLYYGNLKFYDPWSDAIVILCSFVALFCGISILVKSKLNLAIFFCGITPLAIIILGTLNAL
jgi:hypothetical protein